jgi:hypothetical protein
LRCVYQGLALLCSGAGNTTIHESG